MLTGQEGYAKQTCAGPVRVAQIIGKMNAGGVENVAFNYYRCLDHTKVQFDFFYDADSIEEPPQDLMDMGARFYKVPPYQRLPQYMAALVRQFRAQRYQVVHSNMNTLSVFSLGAAWMAGVPVRICHSHSTAASGEMGKNLLKYALRLFARLFATDYCVCSAHAGAWLFGAAAVSRGEVTIFNNAIQVDRFRYDSRKRAEVRRKLDLEGKLVVGHVGRFCFQKNQEFLLEVFAELRKKEPDSVLVLVGGGEQMEAVRERALGLHLEGSVRFLGIRSDVERLYQAMDILVFPSRYEGLGLAAVEAQAAGLPVLCSDAVPRAAAVSRDVRFLPLRESPARWAETASAMVASHVRGDTAADVRAHGYDILLEAEKLERFYIKRVHGSKQQRSHAC